MRFLSWHYTIGTKLFLNNWRYILHSINHYFSLKLLIFSLFSPWKRLVDHEKIVGFNMGRWFEQLSFNLISRCVGAMVRLTLFLSGVLVLIGAVIIGSAGFLVWLVFPLIGWPYYFWFIRRGTYILSSLVRSINGKPAKAAYFLTQSIPGKFLCEHTGISDEEWIKNTQDTTYINLTVNTASFRELVQQLVDKKIWMEDWLRSQGITSQDVLDCASWWDLLYIPKISDKQIRLGRPGIGLELLFGYTPTLNKYAADLSSPQTFSQHLVGREELVSRLEQAMLSGQNIALVGEPGVGKRTVALEFAFRAAHGDLSPKLTYKRILELDYNAVLSQSWDINSKKSVLAALFKEATSAGNIILVIKDIHRITNPWVEGYDFTDVFEEALENKDLKIITISSKTDYERFVYPNFRLRKYFETIEVVPPARDTAMQIVMGAATRQEKLQHITITIRALKLIIEGSDRLITEIPFPEKSLELMDRVVTHVVSAKRNVVTVEDVNTVLSEQTGIALNKLSLGEKVLLANLEDALHTQLIGQHAAVSLIAKSLRSRSMGVKSDKRPIGSFLFLGPTGVGKTQTAKTLAKIYYGSEEKIIRFDMAEYQGFDGIEKLIGSAARNQPGLLTTAVKNSPASLLLLDEIEKATPDIFNLFLTLLDEGMITDAFGRKIVGSYLFVIATSNAGAEYIRQMVSQQIDPSTMQKSVIDYIQSRGIFPPEFLNRFDGVVVYEPLTKEQMAQVAKLMLEETIKNMDKQNITLGVDPKVYEKLSHDGYAPEFGARPMRRIVDMTIGDIISRALLSDKLKGGDRVKVVVTGDGPEDYALEPML